jgi:hypothetical protein
MFGNTSTAPNLDAHLLARLPEATSGVASSAPGNTLQRRRGVELYCPIFGFPFPHPSFSATPVLRDGIAAQRWIER